MEILVLLTCKKYLKLIEYYIIEQNIACHILLFNLKFWSCKIRAYKPQATSTSYYWFLSILEYDLNLLIN